MIVESEHWKESAFLKSLKRVPRKGRPRWISKDGTVLYEWDELHREIEVYNKKGLHINVLNKDGSQSEKGAVNGRRIDV